MGTLSMKYIMRVSCPADCMEIDGAVVDIGEELLAIIKGRRRMFDMVHGDDRDLYSMRFWCGEPDFFDCSSLDDKYEDVADDLDLHEVGEAPKGFAPEPCRVECVTMVVTDSGVHWTGYPKHADDELASRELRWDLLFPATTES